MGGGAEGIPCVATLKRRPTLHQRGFMSYKGRGSPGEALSASAPRVLLTSHHIPLHYIMLHGKACKPRSSRVRVHHHVSRVHQARHAQHVEVRVVAHGREQRLRVGRRSRRVSGRELRTPVRDCGARLGYNKAWLRPGFAREAQATYGAERRRRLVAMCLAGSARPGWACSRGPGHCAAPT